jgi:ERCC4-related helicase
MMTSGANTLRAIDGPGSRGKTSGISGQALSAPARSAPFEVGLSTVEHARIRPGIIEERAYQTAITAAALSANTLVVLPTGLGKTSIALRVMAEFLRVRPGESILFLAPTRPLVVQHARTIEASLLAPPPIVLTGAIPPERRAELLHPPQIVVATPQVIGNDLARSEFPLAQFGLVVFDEAHRAVGDYPYVAIGRALTDPRVRILAMTASPGSRIERVREVWENLRIAHFEVRTVEDPDVAPYSHVVQIESEVVRVPAEVMRLANHLKTVAVNSWNELQRTGHAPAIAMSRRELLDIGRNLDRQIAAARARGAPASGAVWAARTAQAIAMKANHAVELIETQGVESLRQYLDRQAAEAVGKRSGAMRGFLNDPLVVQVRHELGSFTMEHPKIARAVEIVTAELKRDPNARVIVFTQYRQTAERLIEEFATRTSGTVRPKRFVGQASRGEDEGMSQKEQVAILDEFRAGRVNCLVATSVAEEGLDIPSTDLVLLYEPVPDEIRTIQRRGRTGRLHAGRAIVLIAEGTRDEGMFRAAQAKERRMHEMLERVELEHEKGGIALPPRHRPAVQRVLGEFGDQRES